MYEYIIEVSSEVYSNVFDEPVTDDAAILQKILEVLPPQRRKVFCMCKLEGKSYKEVSSALGISVSTINDHIVKATNTAREFILSHPEINAMSFFILLIAASISNEIL